jgi:hypothetical protein
MGGQFLPMAGFAPGLAGFVGHPHDQSQQQHQSQDQSQVSLFPPVRREAHEQPQEVERRERGQAAHGLRPAQARQSPHRLRCTTRAPPTLVRRGASHMPTRVGGSPALLRYKSNTNPLREPPPEPPPKRGVVLNLY